MKRSNVLYVWIVILPILLMAQDMDVMEGIQRRDTSRTLAPLDLNEIPDEIERTSEQESAESVNDESHQALIDSLENRFNLEKERLEANFRTSYEYRLTRAVDSIRMSIAGQISAMEEEIERLQQQSTDSLPQVDPSYLQERDSLLEEIRSLEESLSDVRDKAVPAYSPDEIKKEQAFYQYLLQLMEQKSNGQFLLKDTEIPDLKKRELSLYLEMYLPDLNSSEVMIRLARVYEDLKEAEAAKLSYLKYLFYFPESTNLTYIKEQIQKLTDTYPAKHDTLLSGYLNDETRQALEGCTRYKYIRALADIGYPGCESLFDREIASFQKEAGTEDRVDMALIWYADILKNRKLYKSAISQLQKVVMVYPGSPNIPRALFNMAEIYRDNLKESRTALEHLRKLSQNYKENPLAPRALIVSGEIHEKDLKDPVAALTEYEKVPTTYPGTIHAVTALKNMGRIYQSLSKSSELAFKQYELIKKDYASFRKDAAEAMVTIAGLYESQGEFRAAVEEIRELYNRYPEYKKVPDQLLKAAGFLEKQLVDTEEAGETYDIIITQYPETKASEKARKALGKLQKE